MTAFDRVKDAYASELLSYRPDEQRLKRFAEGVRVLGEASSGQYLSTKAEFCTTLHSS